MAFKTASRTQVTYAKLDIADRSSVESFASTVKEKYGVVDVLINNAGVNLDDEYSAKNVKVTLDTNVRSTLQVSLYVFIGPFPVGKGLKSSILSAKRQSVREQLNHFLVFVLSEDLMASIRRLTY